MISLSRINLLDVVHAHLRTLRRLGQPGIYTGDLIFFFGVPAAIALPLAYCFGDRLYEQAANLLTAVSIIGGFLFSLLAMTAQIVDKVRKESPSGSVRRIFAKEIHANVAFGIILSLACVVSLVVFAFLTKPVARQWVGQVSVAWLTFFLIVAFFLTLLMIVKRLFIILSSDVEDL